MSQCGTGSVPVPLLQDFVPRRELQCKVPPPRVGKGILRTDSEI